MRNRRPLLAAQTVWCIGATTLLFSGLVGTSLSQTERPAGPPDLKREQRNREHREAMLRTAETGVVIAKLDERRIEAAVNQLRDDFRQVQIIRNEIARNVLANRPLDYKHISNRTGEVGRRASRMKTYMMPPVPEDTGKKQKSQIEFDGEQMKEVLAQLCNLIDSFVENPVLKSPGRVDVEESTRAGGDLLSIIELSGAIKRSAEKLSKANR